MFGFIRAADLIGGVSGEPFEFIGLVSFDGFGGKHIEIG